LGLDSNVTCYSSRGDVHPIPRNIIIDNLKNDCDLGITTAEKGNPLFFWEYWTNYTYFTADVHVNERVLANHQCMTRLIDVVNSMSNKKVRVIFYRSNSKEVTFILSKLH
jgi:hypothetical protein